MCECVSSPPELRVLVLREPADAPLGPGTPELCSPALWMRMTFTHSSRPQVTPQVYPLSSDVPLSPHSALLPVLLCNCSQRDFSSQSMEADQYGEKVRPEDGEGRSPPRQPLTTRPCPVTGKGALSCLITTAGLCASPLLPRRDAGTPFTSAEEAGRRFLSCLAGVFSRKGTVHRTPGGCLETGTPGPSWACLVLTCAPPDSPPLAVSLLFPPTQPASQCPPDLFPQGLAILLRTDDVVALSDIEHIFEENRHIVSMEYFCLGVCTLALSWFRMAHLLELVSILLCGCLIVNKTMTAGRTFLDQ